MGVRLLGTLEVVDHDGRSIEIGGTQPRVILAMLVAADGQVVSVDSLVDAVWEDSPPASASGTLQTYVSRLRRTLDPVGGSIRRDPAGYRLEVDRDEVDLHRFESLADEGRAILDRGDPAGARQVLIEAEGLWRGPALLEVRDRPRLGGLARRLDDRRLAAVEDRVAADLALGRHPALTGELAQLTIDHPLREGLWELLALARYRAGLQADALRAIAEARAVLVEGLGVEPGPRLRELEQAILAHDPALALVTEGPGRTRGSPASTRQPPSLGDGVRGAGAADGPTTPGPRLVAGAPAEALHPPATESVRTAEVGPDESDGRAPEPNRGSLIGRDAELAALRRAACDARAGRPCVAVIEGEAGVGKTRLVEELVHETTRSGGTVAWGRCLEGGVAPAYWPWIDVLRPLRAIDPDRGRDHVDQVLDATGVISPSASPGDGSRLLEGVLALLDGSGDDLLVVVLEDLQWADPESLELAAQVVSGMTSGQVLVVVTLRSGEEAQAPTVLTLLAAAARRPGTQRLRLSGLSAHDTSSLLSQVSGRPVDVDLALTVHDRTEGNPFYAIELQRLLDADGIGDAESAATVDVPVGVRDVVRQRLARLPRPTTDLLSVAAVAGRDIDVELVSVAGGRSVDDCLDDLEVAIDHGLLVEGGTGPRFSHALVREVVVDELSSLRRARLHLTVADAIEALGRADLHPELLAEHLWAAVPVGASRRAAEALDRAADVAIRRFAVSTACDLLERSLELRRSAGGDEVADAEELDTIVKLVWALRARGGYQSGLDHYQRGSDLAERLGRHEVALDMQWWEWAGHDTACDFERARPVADRFRDRAETSDDPVVQLAGFTAWAIQCWHDGDLVASADAFALVARAREALAGEVDELSLAAELVVLSTTFGLYVHEQLGRLDDPEDAFAAAASAVAGNFPAAIVWCLACTSAASTGDLDRLERYARRVLHAEAGEMLGFWGSQARMYLGAVLVATGRIEEGRGLFEAGHRAYSAAGLRTGVALMLAAAASAEVAAGDLDRAARHLEAARTELGRSERWPAPYVLLATAEVAEASGAPGGDVLELRMEAMAVASSQGSTVAEQLCRAAACGQRWWGGGGLPSERSASSPSSA